MPCRGALAAALPLTLAMALAILQTISAQVIPAPYATSPADLGASYGGGLSIISSSAIAPTGVSIVSENVFDGPLAVSGATPFLGVVALEGALPTAGSGAVSYGCGSGNVAIMSEDYAAPDHSSFAYDRFGKVSAYDTFAPVYDSFAGFGYVGPLGYGFA